MEVTHTKYKVATPSTSGFRLVDVHMYQSVFTTTIDAMLYFEDFRNFNNLPQNASMLETGTKATNRTYMMSSLPEKSPSPKFEPDQCHDSPRRCLPFNPSLTI